MLAFLVHVTAQAGGFGINRYQIKHSARNFFAFLNTEIQMKFHLKALCKFYGEVRDTVFLAVHGKIF